MSSKIILTSDQRGKITIPKRISRFAFGKYYVCFIRNEQIVLQPLIKKEDFFEEEKKLSEKRKNKKNFIRKLWETPWVKKNFKPLTKAEANERD